jgi:hypothetical protein
MCLFLYQSKRDGGGLDSIRGKEEGREQILRGVSGSITIGAILRRLKEMLN